MLALIFLADTYNKQAESLENINSVKGKQQVLSTIPTNSRKIKQRKVVLNRKAGREEEPDDDDLVQKTCNSCGFQIKLHTSDTTESSTSRHLDEKAATGEGKMRNNGTISITFTEKLI